MSDCRHYQETLRRLQWDPEVAISDALALHLDDCAHCRGLFDASQVPFDPDSFEVVPPASRKRILQALAAARSPSRRRLLVPTAVAVLAVIGLGAAVLFHEYRPDNHGIPIATSIVQDHIRYLTHPDRQSDADLARFEAYVDAYVDFPFELPDIPAVRLTGMRRCLLVDRRAALAFYDTATGPASFFIVPADGLQLPGSRCDVDGHLFCAASNGYLIVSWQDAGLIHAMVGSDETELLHMARSCTENINSSSIKKGDS